MGQAGGAPGSTSGQGKVVESCHQPADLSRRESRDHLIISSSQEIISSLASARAHLEASGFVAAAIRLA